MAALTKLTKETMPAAGFLCLLVRLREILPKGLGLSQRDWNIRHRFLLLLLWAHVFTFPLITWTFGGQTIEGLVAAVLVAILALVATLSTGSRRAQSVFVSIGLASASGFIVHLSGGYIEFHFHYFVMATLLVLYQDWAPFLTMVSFVALQHGVLGVIHPHSVYNHPAAIASPWKWAALHATYIAAACIGSIVAWRKTEDAVEAVRAANNRLVQEVERRGKAEQALQQAHDYLEINVQQRTADLTKTNDALTQEMLNRQRAQESLRHEIDERKNIEHALRESEARFRTLADHIPQLAWMADESGSCFWYNERWFEYTGTTLDEMQGWGWQNAHHPDHVTHVVTTWRRAQETGEPWEESFPLRGKDGRYRWFLTRAIPIRDQHGRVLRWFGTNTDITEQREAERDIRRLLHEAELRERELKEQQQNLVQAGKLASIGELASGIAHELNNPLNNIGLFVGNVLDSVKANTVNQEHASTQLQEALYQVRKAGTIINELRTFSRTAHAEKGPVQVNHVVESALMLLQEQLRLENVNVETDLLEPSIVLGNGIKLEQVLVNLLSNAKDALEGLQEKRLTVRSVRHGGWVELTVQDSGCGIAPDIVDRIFDPFFTTKAVGKGTGLGLSISYAIIKEHGGTITVESSPGKGTGFVVRLPLSRDDGAAAG